ncbi:hypothetical protein AZE42_04325 [Rhizopogon vesiculosus]|uniref:VWFA domain-containing protein n=1 Tax=Rhizopogon vesiculosus TaxID=180088 RepID=A0A1J8Q0A1_9AGAM|nr:hypothetical protein AZE42_04325 [Rhizopogon vesiculosus]
MSRLPASWDTPVDASSTSLQDTSSLISVPPDPSTSGEQIIPTDFDPSDQEHLFDTWRKVKPKFLLLEVLPCTNADAMKYKYVSPTTNAVFLIPHYLMRSTTALKVRVIKASLHFVLTSLGTKDRLSLVTFEVGPGGRVRQTPYLCVSKSPSRGRLSKFIDEIRRLDEGQEDEFLVRASKEKTDVVTAVSHALDVVLQRKYRNPISGMVLVSDTADSTRRTQMDLVLTPSTRLAMIASMILLHFGSCLTYTFVKDWYDLRGRPAGRVGGMMSIGLLNMKLHMKIVDGQRFRICKVSADLRLSSRRMGTTSISTLASFTMFVQSMGPNSLIDDGAHLVDGMMDRMIDEVPVFEVDGSFYDPAALKQVSRLAHPVLLTITLLPLSNGASGIGHDHARPRPRFEEQLPASTKDHERNQADSAHCAAKHL